MNLLVGLDIGTSAVKTSVYSVKGECICSGHYEYPTVYPEPGSVEQDPRWWWEGVVQLLRTLSKKIPLKDIVAIGLSGFNGLVPVGKEGKPLRNAIVYTDRRSIKQCLWIQRNVGEEKVFEVTGNRVSPGTFSASLVLWIRDNQPEIYARTFKFLVPSSYIAFKLTSQYAIDWSRASMTLLFEIKNRVWSEELCRSMDVSLQKLPKTISSWTVVGEISNDAAKKTGLKAGIPVVIGGMDSMCSALGGGVVGPGVALDIGGSAGGITTCSKKPMFDRRFLNVCYVVPDLWAHIGPMNTAGASLEWYKDQFGQSESLVAQEIETSPYELLCQEAGFAEPGAGGLIFLPYLAGERCPIWDPLAKGVFFGLTLKHGKREIIRSILEGVAFGLRHIVETFEEQDITIDELRAIGGGARNRIWRQIKADIIGKPITMPEFTETATLGAALLAGYGIGAFQDLETTSKKFLTIVEETKPRSKYMKRYSQLYSLYKEIYKRLRRSFTIELRKEE